MAGNIQRRLNKVLNTLNNREVSEQAFKFFKEETPYGNPRLWKSKAPKNYRPGNARRRTRLVGNDVEANYAYALRLEKGWSTQAPDGMTKPTIERIRDYVYQKLGVRI